MKKKRSTQLLKTKKNNRYDLFDHLLCSFCLTTFCVRRMKKKTRNQLPTTKKKMMRYELRVAKCVRLHIACCVCRKKRRRSAQTLQTIESACSVCSRMGI